LREGSNVRNVAGCGRAGFKGEHGNAAIPTWASMMTAHDKIADVQRSSDYQLKME
jgi:hypothetical protein